MKKYALEFDLPMPMIKEILTNSSHKEYYI